MLSPATLCYFGGCCGGWFVLVDGHHGRDRPLIVIRRHVCVAHGHLDVSMPQVAGDNGDWNAVHDPTAGRCVAEVVEVKINQTGFLDTGIEPILCLSEGRL